MLDDEPVFSDVELVSTATAAAAAANEATVNPLMSLAATYSATTGSAAAAAATTVATRAHLRSRRASPPPPLLAPFTAHHWASLSGAPGVAVSAGVSENVEGASGGGASSSYQTPTTSMMYQHDPSLPGCWWSPGYTPSCVSTESPSPSSPSAAPSFGGVPMVPSPPQGGGAVNDVGAVVAAAAAGVTSRGARVASSGDISIGGGFGVDAILPSGVTPAAFANATALAARINASSSLNTTKSSSVDGRGSFGGRNRFVSYSDRQKMMSSAASTGRSGGSGCVGGPGLPLSGKGSGGGAAAGGGGGAVTGRARSASEDAVWDMLPSDESQCRRPFSVSAVEGRHGY